MGADDFWSVDKLLPKIRQPSSLPPSASVALSELSKASRTYRAGKKRYPISRVIRSVQFLITGDPFSVSPKSASPLVKESLAKKEKRAVSFSDLVGFCDALLSKPEPSALQALITLWELYQDEFAIADKFFSDLILDLCLFLDQKIPYDRLSPLICRSSESGKPFLQSLFLFDHLLTSSHHITKEEQELILKSLTKCGFRSSKAYRSNPRFAGLCEEILDRAFEEGLVQKENLNSALLNLQIPSEVKTERKLFSSLPAHREGEIRIRLVYLPLLYDENIRDRMDGMLRYLENRVRAMLRMKNNLSRVAIGAEHKDFLDRILFSYEAKIAVALPSPEPKEAPPQEARKIRVDLKKAYEIEEESWETTKELTRAFTQGETEFVTIGGKQDEVFDRRYEADLRALSTVSGVKDGEYWEFAALLTPEEEAFVCTLLYQGTEKAREQAFLSGQFFEQMIASVNLKAQDAIGDVICDAAGNLYEDYIPSLQTVFFKGEEDGTAKH